ncbi:MAG: Sapep family Mn(2+)-dependent dipeptidase [Eubacteriales bacterium]|nr:Sapep family Mn(2+)-dependent dipeptidase [Eubacteriales bacterium]
MNIKEFVNDGDIQTQFENDLRSLIEIPSVAIAAEGIYPYGTECAKALDKALEIAKRYGFKTENHDYHCGSVILGDAEDENKNEIGIIAHLDVVPAGTGWTYEPYTLTVDKDLYIGRGSEDDKGPLLMGLYAMRYFNENKIKLPFSVRLIMGCDEEVGATDLEYYKTVRNPPRFSFTPDAKYPVCVGEKGIMRLTICLGEIDKSIESVTAGTVTNAVPCEATAVINGKAFKAAGTTAHASMPENGINAISLLTEELLAEGMIPENNKNAFEFLRESGNDYLGGTLGINFSDENFGYLTCVASVLKLTDGKLYQDFDIRYPTSRTYDELYDTAEKAVKSRGFSIVGSNRGSVMREGYFKSPESREIKALTSACEEVLDCECKPYTMGGGTYARSMPGAVAFGARIKGCTNYLGAGRGKAHDRDEYLSIIEFKLGLEIFIKSLLNLGASYGD